MAAAPVIRPTVQDEDDTFDFRRLLPAWIISGVIHVVLLSLFLLVYVGSGSATTSGMENTIIETKVDDNDVKEANLTNDDIGNDPDLPTNYNIERLDDVSVPGPLMPNEAVGILNAPDGPKVTLGPPPGFGGSTGQGGGIDDPTKAGNASMMGFAGGMGGPRLGSGMAGRSGATREKMLQEGGGNTKSEAAVAAGLKWIVRHQALDGHWGFHDFHVHGKCNCSGPGGNHDVAGTTMGLLPLLGAGETHKGTGKNHIYSKNVERALKWLVSKQGAEGGFSGNGYEHGMATLAICEAYGVTADPWLKGPAQRAVQRCVTWQRPNGGFRYQHPPANDSDLSVVGWFVQAVKSGSMAGLQVPNSTYAGINQYLDTVSVPSGDGYGYTGPQPTPTMTAVGLLSRQYMGWGPRNPGLAKGVENLQKVPPKAIKNMYYYYYATQVVHHFGGEAWDKWNPDMRDWLIETQDQGLDPDHKDQKGSWSAAGDAWGGQLGRLGYTGLAVLTLEVYYRYLPLYRRELGAMKDEAIRDAVK